MLTLLLPPALETAVRFIEKYVFSDWNALMFLMVLFLLDTGLGMLRSFRQGRFHSRGMRQMFTKLRDYGVGLIVAHVLSSVQVDGQPLPGATYFALGFKGAIYFFILIIETKSIDENLRNLGGRGLPLPKFLRRGMQDWEETGQFRSKLPPEELPLAPESALPTAPDPGAITPVI
ncbi:phage holin family protein [Hymenobacter rigui]|nr:phage holin family protein [Hymenobacter rigui]